MSSSERINWIRRLWLQRMIAAGIMGTLWRGGGRQALALPAPPPRSILHRRKGIVEINGVPADVGTPVASGDQISTGPDSEAVFVLGDDGFLLRADSQVTITDLGQDRTTGKAMRELTLVSGRVLSVFGPKQISLKTPLASIGIRGTAAYLESSPASMNVCVCYGHAVMTPEGAPKLAEEVENHHHETPRVVFPGPNGPVMEALRIDNHSDDELIMLEALLGRVPPFLPK
ncbi:conserved hypothetical protein [Candidatus Terasakiella magnetica]|nr:conserved hypothetical protein [Candidatus Terasakiella magnetica]